MHGLRSSSGQKPFTLEAWVRPHAAIDGSANTFVEQERTDQGMLLFMQSEILKFERGPDDRAWFTQPLPRDRFTHVVGVYDGSVIRLFVDGLDVQQSPSTVALTPATGPLQIARNVPATVDEVAIYDHALSNERRAHYRAGTKR